jgi:hypothetical protein
LVGKGGIYKKTPALKEEEEGKMQGLFGKIIFL